MLIKLKEIVSYSKDRIDSNELTLNNYVTTDNLLQNKGGKVDVITLPQSVNSVSRYTPGDILVSNIRPYLKKIWYSNLNGGASSDVLVFKVKSGFDSKFIYYSLFRDDFFIHMMKGSKGTKMPRGTKSQILDFKIPNFHLNKQKQIAKVLSDLDAKIEVNNQINTKLVAMAKTLYEYWFVQFDFPYVTSSGVEKPYKSSGGKMVYNDELKREIPEGWEVKSLVDIANFKNGIACQKYRPVEADKYLNVIKIREMRDGFTSNTEKVRDDLSSDIIINDGDILFSWSASLIVQIWAGGKGALNQHIFKVTSESYPRGLVYYETLEYLKYFQKVAELRKTTMGHITKEHLVASRICVPPKDKFNDCLNQIDKILDKIVINKKQNQKLADLRDWLLPMLMNGQVSVGENTSLSELSKRAKERKEKMKRMNESFGMVAEESEVYKSE